MARITGDFGPMALRQRSASRSTPPPCLVLQVRLDFPTCRRINTPFIWMDRRNCGVNDGQTNGVLYLIPQR
jgi:hypothetical protein